MTTVRHIYIYISQYFCSTRNAGMAGVFLYVFLVSEVGHVSIELSEYRVLCQTAAKQILLCLGAVAILVLVFALAITGMLLELSHSSTVSHEWEDMGSTITTLTQMTVGIMDLSELHHTLEENPFLFVTWQICGKSPLYP